MAILLLSLLMLAIAPWLYGLANRAQALWHFLDYSIVIVVTALVVLHLLPESIRVIGFWAVILALLGLALPSLSERLFSKKARQIHFLSVAIGVLGLAGHGMLDGAALAIKTPQEDGAITWLSLAVLLHRVPAGYFIWSVFYPLRGAWVAGSILFGLGLFTVIGFLISDFAFSYWLGSKGFFAIQALTTGTLLHIALDRHDADSHDDHDHHGH